ncbi:1,4-dihydroxy-2-naphthoate octaprenyltransferase [Paracrocinitomix mangrovi]|uniref:1,4-dihydroxy-2-naphthoate octaprenyltransferase n=1 Tax=Paracrocinitomix mangrovi TaxID=2862509 RepID=UPI001C8E704A|nr:1,4-dihydroxy-2-naphthoate octaprenyltransferase [Paracrocinitomix mangrovi]UKN02157.1 1,4-dihydroxy-2-naphthoate octaprenyltransferase [Paracrocinitomix mangrovi]
MSKTKAWISAMRLRTLPLSFSVIIVGNGLAYSLYGKMLSSMFGTKSGSFRWDIFGLTLLTTLLLQILSNFANDYGDSKKGADNEGRIGPERAVQSGIISSSQMLKAVIITALLSLISGIALLYVAFGSFEQIFIEFLILGVLAILGAIGYTVGKKAYGYLGLGDFFVFLFFGLLGVFGSFYLHHQILYYPAILFGVMMGAISTAVLNLNNMRDRENDSLVGKKTLAVRLGFGVSKVYHYILFGIFWVPIVIMLSDDLKGNWLVLLMFTPVLAIHVLHLRKVAKIQLPAEFDPELKKVALSAFLFSLIFFMTVYFGL